MDVTERVSAGTQHEPSYGVLAATSDDTVEFTVAGRLVRTWATTQTVSTLAELLRTCLIALGNDGWRPISHRSPEGRSVILARVPYTAGSKLPTFGNLRRGDAGGYVLSVGGSVMREWQAGEAEDVDLAVDELREEGWTVERRYVEGVILKRG